MENGEERSISGKCTTTEHRRRKRGKGVGAVEGNAVVAAVAAVAVVAIVVVVPRCTFTPLSLFLSIDVNVV